MSFVTDPFELIFQRVATELRKHIPIGPNWFSQAAIDSGLLSQILGVATTQITEWLGSIKDGRDGTFLNDATGPALVNWGLDLQIPKKVGESDDAYRTRLQGEIVRLRVVRAGIESYIFDLTGLPTTVFLPWKSVDFRGNRNSNLAQGAQDLVYGRSGTQRRESTYWQGAIVDINTLGYDAGVKALATRVVAAGVFCYYTAIIEPEIALDWGVTIPNEERYIESESQTVPVISTIIRSTSGCRSGGPAYLSLGDEYLETESLLLIPDVLYDEPAGGVCYEVFNSPFEWAEIQDLTWDAALSNLEWLQAASDTTISH